MKRIYLLNIFTLLLWSVNLLWAQTPIAANGRLKVVNRQLTNESGKAIQLRGISSHGLHWFDQCYTAGSIQTLATNWGADVFRAAMYVHEGGYLNNPSGLRAKVDQVVDWTAQAGIYCIIDWHTLNPGDPNVNTTEAKDFFRYMAQKHAGKKHVIYEICNEPNGVSWAQVKNYADQVVPVIRQYDTQAIILCGTPQWCQRPQDVLGNQINDPNVMYTFHYYTGSHYFQNDIRAVSDKLPLFASEWGTSNYTGDGDGDYTNAQAWVDLMAGNNPGGVKISWCNWSFADKPESSAALNPGACGSAAWNNTSTSGAWVKNRLLSPADDFGPATPSVAITSPANNATVTIGTNVTISATVSNATATTVEFYNGTTKLGEDATAPYQWVVANIAQGTYSFTAKALRSGATALTSSAVQVTAATAQNRPPTVSLTAPANNASFTAPASINLTANASDSDGSIGKVEFYNGTTKLGEDATAPYTFSWSNVAAGSYTLTARATDNQGATATSTQVNIAVNSTSGQTADIIGPDCVVPNAVKTFEVSQAQMVNATNTSWWCEGSTKSITATQLGKATIDFGPSFTGGKVCVGVNYSVAPWHKQLCKTVTVCAGARLGATENTDGTASVFPNPSSDQFTFIASKDVRQLNVVDELGRQKLQLNKLRRGQRITFGEQLPAGLFLLHVQYEDNTRGTLKAVKVNK